MRKFIRPLFVVGKTAGLFLDTVMLKEQFELVLAFDLSFVFSTSFYYVFM